jgi:type IV pilus assembly protein PilV
MMQQRFRGHARQRGGLMIEVLIAIALCAFGLLGLFGVQARATSTLFETSQRTQALILVSDMVSRLNANRANAGDYVTEGLIGAGPVVDCAPLSGAALDLCEWGNLIRGSLETRNGGNVGAMLSARGCVTRSAGTSDLYVVSLAWTGTTSTGAPASACGRGDALYPDETLRRVVSSSVCIALLRDPAVPAATPRC